ncbi:hypothetical protein [Jiella pelagia]|uniref:Uncharacterized protein n=1 Tax=Jiella pelagia TaxID=2986949 RepID=A0ABY7BUH2_9HYPH|nr:hypothetical protein [Jiella pelagia]WAP67233.1 hypothetical protein OH818_16790 [Jiella pelagia]
MRVTGILNFAAIGAFAMAGCVDVNVPHVSKEELTSEERAKVEATIKDALKDPYSAHFDNFRSGRDKSGRKYVCVEVNARNSFGAYAGTSTYIGLFLAPTFFAVQSTGGGRNENYVRSQCDEIGLMRPLI